MNDETFATQHCIQYTVTQPDVAAHTCTDMFAHVCS